jgi:putative phosphoesterase
MRVGVLADTHGFFDPRLRERLAGVECILHAGDIDSQSVLDDIAAIAPVHAVRGNVDPADLGIPLSRTLRLEGAQIQMQHILPVPQSELEQWSDGALGRKNLPRRCETFLKSFGGATRVVIFGHSHQPCLAALSRTLFFNPGSAGKKRFSLPRCCGVMEISPRGIRGTILSLDAEEAILPAEVWLPLGE